MRDLIKNFNFFGLPVSALTEESLRNWVLTSIASGKSRTIYGYSLYSVYAIRHIPEIYTLGSKADIFLADGRPFFWLCKIFGVPVVDGISIPQFVMDILKIADQNHLSLMLLGATSSVNKNAVEKIRLIYPGIIIKDGIDGYFSDDRELEIKDLINSVNPDILLVGISSPKKENFVFKNEHSIKAKIIIPCGGMIDVLAGKTKMSPRWIKNLGFAFLYRIIQEPGRLLKDRLKMIIFIFLNFFPTLMYNIIIKRVPFSIPVHYLKKGNIE